MRTSRFGLASCVTVGVAAFVAALFLHLNPAAAQTSKSAAAAKEFAAALDGAKLDSIAAADPSEPGVFVAALYFPGSQILAVSAKYAAPPLLVTKMKEKNYRDIYIDLNSASVAGTKLFIMDQGVDGFVAKPGDDQPADSCEQGNKQITFDGKWKNAKLSEEEYMKAFQTADERYAKILTLLTAQAKASGS
jgi:hypothetical protein